MRWVRRIKVSSRSAGLNLDADVNAVIAVNAGRTGQRTEAHSHSHASVGERPQAPGPDAHANGEDATEPKETR